MRLGIDFGTTNSSSTAPLECVSRTMQGRQGNRSGYAVSSRKVRRSSSTSWGRGGP